MSKSDFESIISGLTKGAANIESVNFHFGDCNSTTYMGGEVEEEYEEEYGSEGCGDCGCCPGGCQVVDSEETAKWVQKKTGIDLDTVHKVLDAEEEYLEEIGVSVPVDFDGSGSSEDDGTEPDSKAAREDKPEQKPEPQQETGSGKEAGDDELDVLFEGLLPGILGMGLMGALLCDILGSAKKKEARDGKDTEKQ